MSAPSWGRMNSGARGITLSPPGLTSTGVSTVWKCVSLPLACRRVEQCSQWIACEEKYSVPSRASRSDPPGVR
ncbi:hypothetical protein [Methylomagnum ishizawai]|uniref:hypothetical protein n=1 Tax=Methylomagnum ishizawai TaxID=1760988 RepID=UPI001C7F8444|nr:hypothetical protein [Methylomagnum ishizawai]